MTLIGSLGVVAALCTSGAFLPQIWKIRKQGGKDLSYSMLAFYLTGVLLWLVYGLLIHAPAVIWANLVATVLVSIALLAKVTFQQPPTLSSGRRPRIAVDMDEVIADSLPHHLAEYEAATGRRITVSEIQKKGLKGAVGRENMERFEELPHQPGFFANLKVIGDSQRALELLSRDFDVYIASAAMDVPFCFDDKFRWLQKHFPFIPADRIVFCGTKEIVNADYLIDDRSRHFARFRGTGILFTAPHNAREQANLRADNWQDVLKILAAKHPVAVENTLNATQERALAAAAAR